MKYKNSKNDHTFAHVGKASVSNVSVISLLMKYKAARMTTPSRMLAKQVSQMSASFHSS